MASVSWSVRKLLHSCFWSEVYHSLRTNKIKFIYFTLSELTPTLESVGILPVAQTPWLTVGYNNCCRILIILISHSNHCYILRLTRDLVKHAGVQQTLDWKKLDNILFLSYFMCLYLKQLKKLKEEEPTSNISIGFLKNDLVLILEKSVYLNNLYRKDYKMSSI